MQNDDGPPSPITKSIQILHYSHLHHWKIILHNPLSMSWFCLQLTYKTKWRDGDLAQW